MSISIEMRGGSWQWGAHCKGEGQLGALWAPQCAHTYNGHRQKNAMGVIFVN